MKYRCILADPPWSYNNKSIRGSAQNHYTTLSDEMISGLPVEKLADNDAFLFLWVTNSILIKGRHLAVCSSWGFTPKTLITWIKLGSSGEPIMGMGFYTRGVTEHLVLARRGLAMRNRKDLLNIIMDKRGPHSQKPLRAYQLIERFCDGPRLELFAREKQSGWDCWGDEIKSDINLGVMGKWPRN